MTSRRANGWLRAALAVTTAVLALLRGRLADLAAQWGAMVVAEGIENARQLKMVRDIGIGEGQGYLLGRPETDPSPRMVDIERLLEPDRSTTNVWPFPSAAAS